MLQRRGAPSSQGDDADVVVVGAGMAGFAAAIAAAELGASVLLLEKMAHYGGGTAWSGGAFCFSGTEEQAAVGINDSADLLRQDLTRAGADKTNQDLVSIYIDHQHETYLWLRRLGIQFASPVLSPGQSVPRSIGVNTRTTLRQLYVRFTRLPGCTYRAAAEVLRIDRDQQGVARLVHARIDGVEQTIAARRAVVLASGGFPRNRELLRRYAPALERAKPMGGEGASGDGLRIGMGLGGDATDFGWIDGTFGSVLPNYPDPSAWTENDTILLHACFSGGVIVNREGRRFADESLSYRKLGTICLEQPGAVGFQIFDSRVMATSREEPVTRNLKEALARGFVKQAPTIGQAAELMGLPGDVVEAEIAAYNSAIDTGEPPAFGRRSLLNGQGTPIALREAPFYIYACTTGLVTTYAGLVADGRLALVDVYGDPVPGLFLAGEVVGGFHGPQPVSGTSICKAAIFGKIAGQNAAAFASAPQPVAS